MRYNKLLRLARYYSLHGPLPDKQHIVVAAALEGKHFLGFHLNTESEHAESRALSMFAETDRLVVYRFNRADPNRLDRPSCPCFRCVPLVRRSNVRKVEFMTGLGPVVVKVANLEPYNGPH